MFSHNNISSNTLSFTHFLYLFNTVGLVGVSFLILKKIKSYKQLDIYDVIYGPLLYLCKWQIWFEKIANNCNNNKYVKQFKTALLSNNVNTILYIKDGNEVFSEPADAFFKKDQLSNNKTDCDFFIYKNVEIPTRSILFDITKLSVLPCTFTFIGCEIHLEKYSKAYNILFHSTNESYYAVNNIINKYVIQYLLYKQHGIYMNENESFLLHIIDHNINNIMMTDRDELLLLKDGYEVFRGETFIYETLNNTKVSDSMNFSTIQSVYCRGQSVKQNEVQEAQEAQEVEEYVVLDVNNIAVSDVFNEVITTNIQSEPVIAVPDIPVTKKPTFCTSFLSFLHKKNIK
jgi:hypothetical protein